ncbi:2-thiouracil desulfurase family protein [Chitinimonas naiadis]
MSANEMAYVLVSSCLLGNPVRYNGQGKESGHPVLARWLAEGRVVAVCPEVAGGLPTPRPPAEIRAGLGGLAVLRGEAPVIDNKGEDVTLAFVHGAEQALAVAQARGIRLAVLKEGSPSCGSRYIYDGSFNGTRVDQHGVATACLQAAGIKVFSENEFDLAAAHLLTLA